MGWSPIRQVKKAVSNVTGAVGDVAQAVADPIAEAIQDVVNDPLRTVKEETS
jgi:hypothetical protein